MATIPSTPRTRSFTVASASAGPFNVGFRLFDDDALDVYVDGAPRSDFTVSAVYVDGYTDAATITFASALADGTDVVIDGAMAVRRQYDYINGDPNLVAGLNIELGRIWAAISEANMQAGRSLRSLSPMQPVDGIDLDVISDASTFASIAQDAAAAAALYAPAYSNTLAGLLDDETVWPEGMILNTREEGFAFVVAASSATDHHVTTGGGVKLYALPDKAGFVHVDQFGAIADGNRLTGTGTDNTTAFRRAFATPYNINIGFGTYAVRDTIQNLKENRVVKGGGAGMVNSSPLQDRLYFNAPSCILAIGNAAVRRVITRRKYRANAMAPNDPAMSAVIENWGAGSTFKDFSIELYCDYTDTSATNFGADWDIGFFNGCRSNVGCDHITILGYFRKANFYWDVTDAYGIPNLLDIYGNPVPFPTLGDDDGPEYGRGSGADGCWMDRCEARGRIGRVILGPDRNRTGAPYFDWVTSATYADERGQSGASDFRSRDCALRSEHHSNRRMKDPVGYGATLTYANMMLEPDDAPCVQYIDSGITNSPDDAGPTAAARGIVLDDLRYVSREAFSTRLGQVKELYFGQRTWAESAGAPGTLADTTGADIYDNRANEDTHFYGHLCTNEDTGRVRWENTVQSIFTRWIYSWDWTEFVDRQGRRRAPDQGFFDLADDTNATINLAKIAPGGMLALTVGTVGNTAVPISTASALLWFDVGSTPALQKRDDASASSALQILGTNATLTNANVTDGNLGISAHDTGLLHVRNRLGVTRQICWRIL